MSIANYLVWFSKFLHQTNSEYFHLELTTNCTDTELFLSEHIKHKENFKTKMNITF